jgi:cell division protein FtsB
MAQQIYGNLNGKQNKKGKKFLIIIICIAALVIIALAALGLTIGAGSAGHQQISAAIEENTQLKREIDQLNEEIERLNTEIERLGGELEARPTVTPETYTAPNGAVNQLNPTSSPTAVSPRDYEN